MSTTTWTRPLDYVSQAPWDAHGRADGGHQVGVGRPGDPGLQPIPPTPGPPPIRRPRPAAAAPAGRGRGRSGEPVRRENAAALRSAALAAGPGLRLIGLGAVVAAVANIVGAV